MQMGDENRLTYVQGLSELINNPWTNETLKDRFDLKKINSLTSIH